MAIIHLTAPTCPDCSALLEYSDSTDFSITPEDTCVITCYGNCPECGEEYTWTESFDYAGYLDLQKNT